MDNIKRLVFLIFLVVIFSILFNISYAIEGYEGCCSNTDCGTNEECVGASADCPNDQGYGVCTAIGPGVSEDKASAVYKIKNEAGFLEHSSVNRFSCTGLKGVTVIKDKSSIWKSIRSYETCCPDRYVICGFKAGDDGSAGEIDDMMCCKLEASEGSIKIIEDNYYIDPEGSNTEKWCSNNKVGICAQQQGNDGLDQIKCASVQVNGAQATWIDKETAWNKIYYDMQEIMCTTASPPIEGECDDSSDVCEEGCNYYWIDENVKCCGDDEADCGMKSDANGVICDKTGPEKKDASQDPVVELDCDNKYVEYLYDYDEGDKKWIESNGDCAPETVGNHEFLDVKNNTGNYWAECYGNENSYNDESNGGKNFATGENVTCYGTNEINFYCNSTNGWVDDLDKSDEATCEAAEDDNGNSFAWVGDATTGFCCGDDNNDCASSSGSEICDVTAVDKGIAASAGDIIDLSCDEQDVEWLYDGTSWVASGGTCDKDKDINGHKYLDVKNVDGSSSWAGCFGDEKQNYGTGQSVSCYGDNNQFTVYYCKSDGNWEDDLDKSDEATCEAVDNYVWIGESDTQGKCCGDDGIKDTFDWPKLDGYACFRGQRIDSCYPIITINKVEYDSFVPSNNIGFGVESAKSGFDNLTIMDDIYGNILYKNNFTEDSQIQDFQEESGYWTLKNGEYVGTLNDGFGISIIPYEIPEDELVVIEFTLNTKTLTGKEKNGLIIFDFIATDTFSYGAVRPELDIIELGQVINGKKYVKKNQTIALPEENIKVRVEIEGGEVSLLIKSKNGEGGVVNENGRINYCSDNGKNYCEIVCDSFCSYETNNWKDGKLRSKERTWLGILPENGIPKECCKETQCWNGTNCINDQSDDPESEPHENKRCINGNWVETELKYTWDYKYSGYCPEISQCLVNPEGEETNFDDMTSIDINKALNNDIQCISDGQFIGDHYCENGNWTTRTKLIALQLLDFVTKDTTALKSTDYVLFCDSYENTLNYYDYEIIINYNDYNAEDYINKNYKCVQFNTAVPCINKFCVLKYKVRDDYSVAIGASLNNEIDQEESYSALELFGQSADYCSENVVNSDSGQFESCGSGDIWYNNNLSSIVYAKDGIQLGELDFWQQFLNFLKNPFKNIFNKIINIIRPRYTGGGFYDYSFIKDTKDFNRLYLSRKDSKSIHGIMENVNNTEFLSATYEGFSADICESVDAYWQKTPAFGVISCDERNNIYHVETQSLKRMNIWKDLTSKLRIQE